MYLTKCFYSRNILKLLKNKILFFYLSKSVRGNAFWKNRKHFLVKYNEWERLIRLLSIEYKLNLLDLVL